MIELKRFLNNDPKGSLMMLLKSFLMKLLKSFLIDGTKKVP